MTRLTRMAITAGFVGWGFALSANADILTDTFESDTAGQPPTQWTTSDSWTVSVFGGNQLAENTDATGNTTARTMDQSLGSTVTQPWTVGFEYDWQWGGSSSTGNYDLVVTMDMLDDSDNGYRVAVHQGAINGGAGAADALMEVYRIDAGVASSALDQGQGYDQPGWKSLGLSEPALYPVQMTWDEAGQLTVYRDVGSGWESVATATDSTYNEFTHVTLGASGWGSSEVPEFDNVTVAIPEPASALLGCLGFCCVRAVVRRRKANHSRTA